MKKYLGAVILLLGVVALAHAVSSTVWRSSTTATADTTKNLCMNRRGLLHGVCISSATTAASTFTVYSSSATTANPLVVMDGKVAGCMYFDVIASTPTGLSYSNSSTANVTILYDCF